MHIFLRDDSQSKNHFENKYINLIVHNFKDGVNMKKNSLNIFVSYGHKDGESRRSVPEVVDAIVKKLEDRNHNVWLDVDQLSEADVTNWPDSDWRSAIYSSIKNSDNVVGFLSERALRQSGVCLDELSIAVSIPGRRIVTVLLESQSTMKIPPTVSRIQWVDMSEWKDHYDFTAQCFFEDGYFDEKLAEIVDRIEQKENQLYQYDINFLLQTLNPSNTVKTDLFDLLQYESDKKGNYIYEDRIWLKEKIREFISEDKHYLLLTGGPGYGKSQFIAHCVHNIEDIYAYYFIRYNKTEGKKDCNLLLRTLSFEIAAKMPDYRRSLIDSIKLYPLFSENRLSDVLSYYSELPDMALFEHLFHCDAVHFVDGNPGKIVIVIDALDESEYNGHNPVIDFLLATKGLWPAFFKFIMTSRETGNILGRFDYFENDIQITRLNTPESDNDVKSYLRKRLKKEEIDDYEFDELTARCEKTFIYARLLIQSIDDGFIELKTIEDIKTLPQGYKGLLQHYFSRAFTDKEFNKVKLPLGVLLANGGSINKNIFMQIVNMLWSNWTVNDFILEMKSFVVTQGDVVCFYHKALNDWLCDEESGRFYIEEGAYRNVILDFCKQYIDNFNQVLSEYYSDDTGIDMFKDAEENGFDYETVKFVFKKCMALMKKVERLRFKSRETAFLTLVLWMAYRHSEFLVSDEVFSIIKHNARNIKAYCEMDQFFIAAAYDIAGEAELAKNNHCPLSNAVCSKTVTAGNCKSAIEYFWFIQNEFDGLPQFKKLYISVCNNIAYTTRYMDHKSPERLNESLSLLEELKDFELNNPFEGMEKNLAELYYVEGIVFFDLKDYEKSIKSLKKAEEYINEYDEDNRKSGKDLFSLVLNQRAACNSKLGEILKNIDINQANVYYNNSIADMKKSLDIRIQIHGINSFYVAVAYDNLARFSKFYETAQPGFSNLSPVIYDYVHKAIDLSKRIFSETGKTTARSYNTMAWCLDADKAYDEKFIEFVLRFYKIDPDKYRTDALLFFDHAISFYKEKVNDIKLLLFMEAKSKIC